MWRWSLLLPVVFLLVAGPSLAQEPALVVENAHVIVGDGTVLERATVAVAGERIVSVSEEPIDVPDARRIDAAGKTVLPGLIDTHVHLLIDPRGPFTPDSDYPHRAPWPTEMSDSLARAYASDGLPQKLRSYLEAGVTTLRSTGDYWPEIVEVQARLASGDLKGPRLEVVGPVFTAPGGHPTQMCRRGPPGGPHAEWCLSHLAVPVDDPGEAKEWVRRVAESGVDAIKMVGPQFGGLEDAALIRALAAEAENRGIPALMHISDRDDAFHALSLGIDQFVHAPFVASDTGHDRLMLNFMRHDDVFASSTISIQDLTLDGYRQADRPEKVQEEVQELGSRMRAARIYAQEGLLAFGTDVPMLAPEEGLRREIRLLDEAGLEPAEVIRTMTLTAARALGHEQDLGTLEAGKLADLIVVDGDPLEDLSALEDVEVVVKGGEVVVEEESRD